MSDGSPVIRAAAAAALTVVLGACASSRAIDRNALKGAWTSGGPSFDMLIKDRTILYEFDMKEHPYRLHGDMLIVDFQDPTLGIQRMQILRLTADELEIFVPPDHRETLRRMRP